MKSQRLLNAIGNIDDRFIADAEAANPKKIKPWVKILASAACLLLLVFSVITTAGTVKADAVYEFRITPSSPEWKTMTTREKIEAYQIPGPVLSFMSTESIIRTIIENDFLTQYFLYDNGIEAFERHMENFNVYRELYKRSDAAAALARVYSDCEIDVEGNIFEATYLEEMIAYFIYRGGDIGDVKNALSEKYESLTRLRKDNPDLFSINNDGFYSFSLGTGGYYGIQPPK